ncbi:response regulator [Candidatus Solincola tengchongensis]|uniref:response regulator n=1 Tax=Candidatus Solincola tengchongensis TaxID=2900693 RepID=UPI002579D7A9|nr:response regulator [Candidatus Solincola tengchongensis]
MTVLSPTSILIGMGSKTVLVIEDDHSIARLIEIVLSGKGFHTHICLDASSALEIFSRVRPDLVILDIHMPRRSGFSVLKRLRQEDATQNTPIVVFSVLTRGKSVDQLVRMGASDFVSKSEGVDALVEKVMSILS